MKNYLYIFLILLLVPIISATDIPKVVTYQGKITDLSGAGINDTVSIVFRMYESETGGMVLWMEGHPNVPVQKGLFNVQLGETTPLALPFDKSYFLELEVNSSPIMPRVAFSTAPYAFRAVYSDTAAFAYSIGETLNNIWNQYDTMQAASFKISGTADAGTLKVSDIKGQDYITSEYSGAPISINDSIFISLFSISYYASGPGSAVMAAFTGAFDDRASKKGAVIEIQFVRDPGDDEVVLISKRMIFANYMVYNDKVITLEAMDFLPSAGMHVYAIRARMLRVPLDAGRFVNGSIKIVEIKR